MIQSKIGWMRPATAASAVCEIAKAAPPGQDIPTSDPRQLSTNQISGFLQHYVKDLKRSME
jgi:hypothetical protein